MLNMHYMGEQYLVGEGLAVAEEVVAALARDPRTVLVPLGVVFDRGVLTLTGEVYSAEIHRAAEEIAYQNPHVLSVTNAIEVVTKPGVLEAAASAVMDLLDKGALVSMP